VLLESLDLKILVGTFVSVLPRIDAWSSRASEWWCFKPCSDGKTCPMLWIAKRILAATWAPREWMVRTAGRHTASEHGGVDSGDKERSAVVESTGE
jgi:hypothetical protein